MDLKNIFFVLSLCFSLFSEAQHSVSGNLSPAEDYQWLIAYKLNPDHQNYIADTAVENGAFSLNIPSDAQTGMYRLVYAVPQEEFYFDFIYNGKEDIILSFDSQKGLSFISSIENLLYVNYFKEIYGLEKQIAQFYSEQKKDPKLFLNLNKELATVQKSFESQSQGLLSGHFISANRPYIPSEYEDMETYVQHKRDHYFDAIDFNDSLLLGSDFLTDKVVNYVFTALPQDQDSPKEKEPVMIGNVKELARLLQNISATNKVQLFNSLWTRASNDNLNVVADFIYHNHLKALATQTNKSELLKNIEIQNRLRLGAVAPEITWNVGNITKKLSSLTGAKNYVIVFWSSTCSHCLQQLPEFHRALKDISGTKVLAIGLEDDDITWKEESSKLPDFIHGIAVGKWESPYVDLYDVHQTPTYYILDPEKRIVARPDDYLGVLNFLKEGK
ncbi:MULTISPECIES: thioredoxin-like domain-containing protein [unclassified Arenibacter]|uniref:TlpA family protein disulfide reductase n=1 Tax=unclassified Arenibacter TaxID=2615047 RepID=UPI000E3418E4|nr:MULTISPECIES: thioredoxin-like domain-containing protein [unclassified Arenibacter]MCM4162269.1 thiol:disulfide interchange protein [Arenibacter sp. A80]RFT57875.1 TlpA family protein disulfide reductase [Arenibacter sp. P308M17]